MRLLLNWLLSAVALLIVSYLAYRLIERPSLRWVESFSLRAREQASPS